MAVAHCVHILIGQPGVLKWYTVLADFSFEHVSIYSSMYISKLLFWLKKNNGISLVHHQELSYCWDAHCVRWNWEALNVCAAFPVTPGLLSGDLLSPSPIEFRFHTRTTASHLSVYSGTCLMHWHSAIIVYYALLNPYVSYTSLLVYSNAGARQREGVIHTLISKCCLWKPLIGLPLSAICLFVPLKPQ